MACVRLTDTSLSGNLYGHLTMSKRIHSFIPRILAFAIASVIALGTAAQNVATQDTPAPRDPNIEAYQRYASQADGNAARGKLVFEGEKARCNRCHTVGEDERRAGPNLLGIADKYDRGKLIEAVLVPSKEILAGYGTSVVVTRTGEVHTGIVKRRTDSRVELFIADGKIQQLSVEAIAEESSDETSLMPAELHGVMTQEEFADLIAYLSDLKDPNAYAMAVAGAPQAIESVARPIRLEPFHDGRIRFAHPNWIAQVPGLQASFLVVENDPAKVWLLEVDSGVTRKMLFLDLKNEAYTGKNKGLMGLAFHPHFKENRKYYVNHHLLEDDQFGPVVIERRATKDLRRDSGTPSRRVLRIEQPTLAHTGGMLEFGADGFLYIGTGDGGPQTDPEGHGQDLTCLNGKVLRIDIDRRDPGLAYSIPKSNPFRDHSDSRVRQEIYAYGLRQAWRFSFDPVTNDLWVGDVGQNMFEDVTIVRAGENHGWNVYEGFRPFSDAFKKKGREYVPPVVALGRKHGGSVTGGYVYRGKRSPSYVGVYIFCDFESKRIWGLTQKNRGLTKIRQIGTAPDRVASFGIDRNGELFALGFDYGMVYRLVLDDSVFE
ncbi:MAG: PQQ-dependent sugar dehydrogenase [Planctomycetes bacterium]|nr:PQQ-dependent sugar dehydrogenase [Planctomycetota bacterium]